MKKLFLIILLLFPNLALAQSQRNPCFLTSNGNCTPVGTNNAGVGNGPLPVGGIASSAAKTYVEGLVGGLSFDLSGNLRVIPVGSTVVVGNQSNANSAVAATSVNAPVNAYNYVWNGATWDQAVAPSSNNTNSGTINTQNASPTGVATANSAVAVSTVGKSVFAVQVSANTLNQPLTIQCTIDGNTWVSRTASTSISTTTTNSFFNLTTNIATGTTGIYAATVDGCTQMRVSENAAVTGSATVFVNATDAPNVVEVNSTVQVQGQSGSGATLAGTPVRTGCKALSANEATVTTGQGSDTVCTLVGVPITKTYSIPDLDWTANVVLSSTAQTAVKAAAAAGIRNYTTACQISGNATMVAGTITIQDGSSAVWSTNLIAAQPTLAVDFPTPLRTTAATALNVVLGTTPVGSVTINCQGYSAP